MPELKKENLKVIVTGGGTGGHLFPGIAVAEEFKRMAPGCEILFIGTDRHVDNKVLSQRNFTVKTIKSKGIKGKSIGSVIGSLIQLPLSMIAAARIITGFNPSIVFGVGGYVTGPVVLTARILGKVTCIHEQNSVPGLANRWLGRFVHKVFLSIPGSESYFPSNKILLTGNPVRTELIKRKMHGEKKGLTLLVLGGSQGAHRVNELVVNAIARIKERLPLGFTVIHQTGDKDEQWVAESYEKTKTAARVSAFIDDMDEVYRKADFVISRAGATTLAEITVLQKASILIPFPYAADNHQEKNAEFLADGGAALVLREKELSSEILADHIIEFISKPDMVKEMGEKAEKLAQPDATKRIVSECLKLIRYNAGSKKNN